MPAPRRLEERATTAGETARRRPGALSDDVLTEKIRLVHTQSRQTYGYRRIRTELIEEHDEDVGRHRVARLMHSAGLQGVTRRKFRRTTRRDSSELVPPPTSWNGTSPHQVRGRHQSDA